MIHMAVSTANVTSLELGNADIELSLDERLNACATVFSELLT
jgi:hypothetical protein